MVVGLEHECLAHVGLHKFSFPFLYILICQKTKTCTCVVTEGKNIVWYYLKLHCFR